MGLFGNKREKSEKPDKYQYASSAKGARASGYGPPALPGSGAPAYHPAGPVALFDGYGQAVPQEKLGKYGKYGGMSKSLYGMSDPMQQAMFLPPQSASAFQAQAAAMLQMQPYLAGQSLVSPFGNAAQAMQFPFNFGQQAAFLPGQSQGQGQSYFPYLGQSGLSPYFDPTNGAFQQQSAFAPYQQSNFYDPSTAAAFAGPYGYIPAAF
jgi:hypothetical protein